MKIKYFAGTLGLLGSAALSHAQLRIVQYNAGDVKTGTDTVLTQIGNEITNGIKKPIDVLVTEEVDNTASATAFVTLLNGIYGAGAYAAAPVLGDTGAGGQQVVIYRTASVQLIASKQVGTVSSTGAARTSPRYQLRPVGYGAAADMYVYASHPKANDDAADAARRGVEVSALRADADALGAGSKVLFAGDMNFYRSSEVGYKNFLAAGNAQAVDVLNTTGSSTFDWTGTANKILHTQSPVLTSDQYYAGQVGGGMNDRFDFQLMTSAMADAKGLAYIPGSMHAFGNNATHTYGQAITTGTYNNAGFTVTGPQVLLGLAQASDHIPVVADYQLPAKLAAAVAAVPSRVIVGASVPVNVAVSNSAPVSFANGADKLIYSVSGAGSISGTGSGTASALATANQHALTLNASAIGTASGTVNVSSSNQDLDTSTFAQAVSTNVIAHASPSLSATVSATSLTVDFGIRAKGEAIPTQSFSLYNRAGSTAQAALDLDSFTTTDSPSKFTTNVGTFSNLAAGGASSFNTSLDTSSNGTFSTSIALNTSDEDLLGASSYAPLSVTLTGIVTYGGDANLDGKVDVVDLGILSTDWQKTGQIWQQGDFNHDGKVDVVDLGILSSDWQDGTSFAAALASFSSTGVPEPTVLGLAAFGLLLRRRRHA